MLDDDVRVQGWRLGVLVIVLFGAMDLLLSRLWTVQVVNSASAQQRSEAQTTVKSRLAPARGAICDRNGLMLAENRPSFDIDFYLGDLRRDYAQNHKGRVPKIQLRPDRHGRPRSEDDIVEIVKESIQPISQTLGLTAPLNEKEIKEHFRTDPDLPYHYMTDLDFATVANFEERNFGVRGIDISQNPRASTPTAPSPPTSSATWASPTNRPSTWPATARLMKRSAATGLRRSWTPSCRASRAAPSSASPPRVTPFPTRSSTPSSTRPTMGNTLYLTIDARSNTSPKPPCATRARTRGAVVVMDPRNGDVLALVSFPNYDPNTFIPHISAKDWDALNNDPTTPLFNRALHGLRTRARPTRSWSRWPGCNRAM
jgi:penicillin-binding protein 2